MIPIPMKRPIFSRLLKPLAALAILASAACGVVKPVEKEAPASDVPVSAASRQQALDSIQKDFVKQGTRTRTFPGGANDGWIEEIKFLKLEEVRTENLKGGKHRIVCRETRQVTRWKTYNGKKKGEPTVRTDESIKNFIF
jgi:hypothetical protein